MSVIFSEKCKKTTLVIEGYKFSLTKLWGIGKSGDVCTLCKTFMKTEGDENVIIKSMVEHNHEQISDECFNKQTLSNSVKCAALDDICERPIKLIRK